MLENVSEVIERLHKSRIVLERNFVPSFSKCPDRSSIPAAFET